MVLLTNYFILYVQGLLGFELYHVQRKFESHSILGVLFTRVNRLKFVAALPLLFWTLRYFDEYFRSCLVFFPIYSGRLLFLNVLIGVNVSWCWFVFIVSACCVRTRLGFQVRGLNHEPYVCRCLSVCFSFSYLGQESLCYVFTMHAGFLWLISW